MIAEKLLRTGLNMVVFAALARSLGPEQFGVFGLVQAAFFIGYPIALFADQQILIKYLVSDRRNCSALQRKALTVKYLGSILVYLVTLLVCYWQFEFDIFILIAVYCLINFVNAEIIYFSYYRAYQKSLIVFNVTASVILPFMAFKLIAIYFYSDLLLVVAIYVVEALTLTLAARGLFFRDAVPSIKKDAGSENISGENSITLRELARDCWPIFTSAFFITLYMRIDQFMIDAMLTKGELGYYTSAVKISEASTIIITAYLLSRFPSLLLLKKRDKDLYHIALVDLMRQCLLYSIVVIIVVFFTAEFIILLLYGSGFLPARDVVIVHLSGVLFIYYGLICTQWLVAEGLQIYRLYRVLAGLVLNVVLNFIFIPKFGMLGAAMTTVATQAFSSVLFNGFSPATRTIFQLQIGSFYFWKSAKAQV